MAVLLEGAEAIGSTPNGGTATAVGNHHAWEERSEQGKDIIRLGLSDGLLLVPQSFYQNRWRVDAKSIASRLKIKMAKMAKEHEASCREFLTAFGISIETSSFCAERPGCESSSKNKEGFKVFQGHPKEGLPLKANPEVKCNPNPILKCWVMGSVLRICWVMGNLKEQILIN